MGWQGQATWSPGSWAAPLVALSLACAGARGAGSPAEAAATPAAIPIRPAAPGGIPAEPGPCLPSSAAIAPAPLPGIETFMQIGACTNPVLSRDGSRLFFTSAASGINQLYRLQPEGWPYQLTFFPGGLSYAIFSPDCRYAVVGADTQGDEQSQMSLLDAQTGALRPLTSDPKVRFANPVWSRDGCRLYYAANAVDPASFYIYEMDASTLQPRLVLKLPGVNAVTDVSPDGGRLLLYSVTSSQDNDLYIYDLKGSHSARITPHTGQHSYSGGIFSADGRSVYCLSDDDPEAVQRLCRIDLETVRAVPLFADGSPFEVETFNLSDNGRFLAWVVNEDGYGRLHLYDLQHERPIEVPDLKGIVSSPVPADAGYAAFTFNSPTRTTDVWVFDFRHQAGLDVPVEDEPPRPPSAGYWRGSSENPAQATFSSYAGVDPRIFHEPTLIRFKSFDGMMIPAFLYLPPGPQHGPIPFIVEAHGGPAQQFRPFFNRHFQYLMEHGFGILAVNFRGSSGYGRAFMEADNYKKRLDSVKDLAAAAQWLLDRRYTARGRIGIKGASYGGFMTLAAMTGYPDLFAAGVDQAGIADFEAYYRKTAEYRRSLRETEYGPASDTLFLRSISPLYKMDRIKGALLVVHGENDSRVPVSEARQVLRALRAGGTPVDSLIFPDEGHGIEKRPNQLAFYRKMVEFFQKYLAASG